MALNSRRRSASSGSRRGSSAGSQSRVSATKGKPVQGRSVQISKQSRYSGGFNPSPLSGNASARSNSNRATRNQNASFRTSTPRQRASQQSTMRGATSNYVPGSYRVPTIQNGMGRPQGGGFTNTGRGASQGRGYNGAYGNGYDSNSRANYNQGRSGRRPVTNNAQKQKRRGLPKAAKVAIVLAILALIVGVVIYTFINSDSYRIQKVSVEGNNHITNEQVSSLASIPEGSTLLNIDESAIVSSIKQNPWAQDVRIERAFPDTLKIVITERSIAAVCEVVVDNSETTQTWALSSDGMWLMEIPAQSSAEAANVSPQIYEDMENVLRITGVPYGTAPVAGEICSNGNISNALSIIDGMTTELADQVKRVTATNSDSTTLTLDNGIEIAFGDSSDIREKERVCLELMEEYPDKISYINVRVVNKPVYRTL